MNDAILAQLGESYRWDLSLYAGLGIVALSLAGRLFRLIPTVGSAAKLNASTLARKMEKPSYAETRRGTANGARSSSSPSSPGYSPSA